MKMTLLAPLAAAALAIASPARPAAAPPACEFDDVARIVAVGDVHGAYDEYVKVLRAAGIVDARDRWAGGPAHFVQLGDIIDRGVRARKALDLLRRLEREAADKGGTVHVLLGNHEAMRMLGDMRYVSAAEYEEFTTPDSADVRRQVIASYPEAQQPALLKETPLGMIEMIRAFGPRGDYGAWLRGKNAVVRINGVVFLHGGISPRVAPMSCGAINDAIRRELTDDLAKTRETPAESLTASPDGPLWYRGLAHEPEAFAPTLDKILEAQGARAIVVGHTVSPTGRIQARFDGKVYIIDTGMNPTYVKNGRASALEIQGDVFTAVYLDGRETLAGARAAEAR
jgi:hypothetical protein